MCVLPRSFTPLSHYLCMFILCIHSAYPAFSRTNPRQFTKCLYETSFSPSRNDRKRPTGRVSLKDKGHMLIKKNLITFEKSLKSRDFHSKKLLTVNFKFPLLAGIRIERDRGGAPFTSWRLSIRVAPRRVARIMICICINGSERGIVACAL